ncbi:MAG: sugar ABC transporter ATP-binding protein [Hydrogenophilales bacterium CG_4_8_14_3_um_filter_62_83]|nr:MAG: sugar ABC transporter ATP-binding protein [Hydrogenophilales bacterium CG15_BIG_FIL_POST_REV_8_21_14_020_62_31]PIW72240.1 MAG: sugar ABC transporter ATP-binding protein [Hydrogenophilales bacterium CG12_big_fil_rev_8_21_14_0_65_61_21]PIX01077.1 MAG: sugar ABC transporter ATP-binding protein [Hydrogenophilales bacterium CG_4_8_14_3_um_filter_62_83]PIY99514.1 MAG: sugar ABC transporter ATP-binding protein [Hydrogenophilales bacterium CG_4_10_14_0_8_um_filter_62_70]
MGTLVVANVGKAYKRYPGKWSRALEWISGRPRHDKTWVLRDISFSVNPGEAVGIIGVNGAGKSTLLKIITGTTQATTGSVSIQGRVAALLELGMGFHPDFTGRQNVFTAGQLLGLRADEIAVCMPAIEAFAEIGDYIDQPVRMYSSGMQIRLAFSVATAVRPDILIVDEALSVGDAYFQHKSFSRIREFREQGTTLLIVSHDRSSIQSLCGRAILLERGFVIKDGNPEEVMDFYNAIIAEKENATVEVRRLEDGRVQTSSGTGEARVESIALLNEDDEAVEFINVGQSVQLKVEIRIHADLPELVFGYMIKDRLGQPVFGTNTHHLGVDMRHLAKGDRLTLVFSFPANIGLGSYSVSTALHVADTHLAANYEWRDLALMFNVVNLNRNQFVGVSWIPPQVEYQR